MQAEGVLDKGASEIVDTDTYDRHSCTCYPPSVTDVVQALLKLRNPD